MGKMVWNIEEVQDHSSNNNFVRIHLDVDLPAADLKQAQIALSAKDWRTASAIIEKNTPAPNRAAVKEVFDSL